MIAKFSSNVTNDTLHINMISTPQVRNGAAKERRLQRSDQQDKRGTAPQHSRRQRRGVAGFEQLPALPALRTSLQPVEA